MNNKHHNNRHERQHKKHHNNKHKRGDIYFCNLGKQDGSLQSGARPVVILQNNVGNLYSPTTIVSPLSCNKKKLYMPTHIVICRNDVHKPKRYLTDSLIMLEQIFTINTSELIEYVGWIDLADVGVDRAIAVSLGLIGTNIKQFRHKKLKAVSDYF